MVPYDRGAAWRGEKLLRELGAGGAVVNDGGEHAGFDSALNACGIRRIQQTLIEQLLQNGVFLGIGEIRAMAHTSVVSDGVQSFGTQLAVFDSLGLGLQEFIGERTIGDFCARAIAAALPAPVLVWSSAQA